MSKDRLGHRVLFPLAGLMVVFAMWIFHQLTVNEGHLPPRQTRSLVGLWQLVRHNHPFAIHLVSFAVYGMGGLLGYLLYAIIQVDRLQLSYTEIGLPGVAQSGAWLIGFLSWGRLVDRQGGLPVLRINQLISVIVPLAYLWATDGWMLLPAFVVQGLINAGVSVGDQHLYPIGRSRQGGRVCRSAGHCGGLAWDGHAVLGAALLRLGVLDTQVFALAALFIFLSWLTLTRVHGPPATPQNLPTRRSLRARWPLRWRFPGL